MDSNLGQYYTNKTISKLLVSNILVDNPSKILELGVGDGSLFRAAKLKWKDSDLIGGDIDSRNVNSLIAEFPDTNLYVINGLSANLRSELKLELGSIDVGICNPPYLPVKKSNDINKIIEDSGLGVSSDFVHYTSDLVFLAQNLLLLKQEGQLGIIIPDGLITSYHFQKFRQNLINKYEVKGVIELPAKVFSKTEAKTYILILKKGCFTPLNVPLYLADKSGTIINHIIVDREALKIRMDYKYHFWKSGSLSRVGLTLSEIGAIIFRGRLSKKELKNKAQDFIHTSDLKDRFQVKEFATIITEDGSVYAEKGDLVIPRVGKRLGKILLVKGGRIPVSDCVFVIRVEETYRLHLIRVLRNKEGQRWIDAHSHGVCAKILSKKDLLEFRIPFLS